MSVETLSRPLAKRLANLPASANTPYAEPDIAQNVLDAAGDALDRGETHYTDRPGIPELRELVAERLNKKYGLSFKSSEVTITCGATEARFCAMHVLAGNGVQVICPGDSTVLDPLIHLTGAQLVKTGSDAPAGSVLYLTPADEATVWLGEAGEKGWWVIWDTTGYTAPDFHPAQQAALAGRVVTIDDLEEQMPGWRVGWMVGSENAGELRAFKQAMTICTTSVSQWAALEFLRSET
jgi:aspartate/methionine/tyrosine aminotransferase